MKGTSRWTRAIVCGALCVAGLLLAAACAGRGQDLHSPAGVSFDSYRRDTIRLLEQRRAFQTADAASELDWNAPREWRPTGRAHRGVLLVHGLGDSPWSFHDLGETLAAQGFLVRTVLLPGHGTRPEDMLDVTLEDWRRVVREQATTLAGEVDQVYLGGFSTGANLALDYAYSNDAVAGLLLFSPAFLSNSTYDWLTPFIGWIRPWLLSPDNGRPMQNAVRYMTVPTNGFAQFYRSSRLARDALERAPYAKPVLMVVAQHDSVLNTGYLAGVFSSRFTHPASRLIWYGSGPEPQPGDPRILVRDDRLPELRISQFSHMAPLFSPRNPLYGANGHLRICWNGQDPAATAACGQGAAVWFSDWGHREEGKIHARLTFNPYYDWQSQIMAQVLDGNSGRL